MKLDQIRVFLEVAELEHVTLASERLHMTQSAVSGALHALESEYEVRLFDRVGRGIKLNATGKAFREKALAITAAVRDAQGLLHEVTGLARGSVKLFASQTISSHWLPERLLHFRALYPQITIEARIGNTRQCVDALEEGRCDLALIEGEVAAPQMMAEIIDIDHLAVIAAPAHPLAQRPWGGLGSLRGQGLLLREQGSGTRSTFDDALRGAGFDPADFPSILDLWSNEAICTAVASSQHLGVVPWIVCAPMVHEGRLAVVKQDLIDRPFRILRHKQRPSGVAVGKFCELLAAK